MFKFPLIKKLHRMLCQFDKYVGSGFLGQVPDDIRSKLYTWWLKAAGASIGKNSTIHHRVKVWFPENIHIGENVKIPASTDLAGMGRISIGDNTILGANTSFITNHHPLDDDKLSWEEKMIGIQHTISVGEFCWIMNGAKLVAGNSNLNIDHHSWIAAGAVVTKNTHSHQLWAGVPAKYVKKTKPIKGSYA